MRVVLEHDSGEIWGQHEIEGMAAFHLLELLSGLPKGDRRWGQPAVSLVEDLRAGSLAEVARREERETRVPPVDFTNGELYILRDALESYWFDCDVGEDDELRAFQPAVEALRAKVERVL